MTLIRCTLKQQKIKSPMIFGYRSNKPNTLALQLTLQWRHLSQRRKKTKIGKREQAMFAVQVDWRRGREGVGDPVPTTCCQFLILIRIHCTDLQINNGLILKQKTLPMTTETKRASSMLQGSAPRGTFQHGSIWI